MEVRGTEVGGKCVFLCVVDWVRWHAGELMFFGAIAGLLGFVFCRKLGSGLRTELVT